MQRVELEKSFQNEYCTGIHLAQIPQISSMTSAVMANVYRESKKNAIQQYDKLMNNGLKKF